MAPDTGMLKGSRLLQWEDVEDHMFSGAYCPYRVDKNQERNIYVELLIPEVAYVRCISILKIACYGKQ